MRVLFVGADNVCVSPLAAALLFQQQEIRGLVDLDVASGGITATGQPVEPAVATLLTDRRIDVSRKRSRQIDGALVDPADLVLTTTASVCQRVVADHAGVVSRCFPLLRFCETVRPRVEGVTLATWLRQQAGSVHRNGPITADTDLLAPDLDDRLAVFELVDQVMLAIWRFVDAGWPDSVG